MILDLIEQDWTHLRMAIYVISWAWASVGIAIGIDFYFGVKKAKELGEEISSEGYRRTVRKANYYYALLFFALIFDSFDLISPFLLPQIIDWLPVVSVFVAVALIITEMKSVREKADEKARRNADKSIAYMMKTIMENKDLMKKISDKIDEENENIKVNETLE